MKNFKADELTNFVASWDGAHALASLLAEQRRIDAMAIHPSGRARVGGDPEGFRINGEVMIRRSCLVAGPAGSEWRNRRQQQPTITNQTPRSNP